MNRGNPNTDAVIHYQKPGYHSPEPLCRNGLYHVKITRNIKYVTCEICKNKIGK